MAEKAALEYQTCY